MQRIKHFFQRHKRTLIVTAICAIAFVPMGAGDNYFELSKNMEIYSDIYKELNIYYVDEINPNELMRTGIDAMLTSLDPYTNYYSEAELENFRFQTTGKYGGIGAIIRQKGDYIAVMEPYQGSPAVKAGLLAGDIIIEVNGKSTKDRSVDEVSALLKGSPGTTVDMLIRRQGFKSDQLFTITREDIRVDNVPYHGMVAPGIGYVNLSQFTQNAGKNVEKAFKDLKDNNELKGVVLDLRGNPGGLLHEAVNLCNIFIDKNKLVVSTKGKVEEWNRDFKTLNKPFDTEIPLIVLVNSGSASASEIVAGTIQDYDRGVIIGQRSYGKGLVQQTRDIAYNTKLKLTTAKYYIPSGRCIQAIDYSLRNEDGSISKIPDSLKNPFKTSKGRVVYDGGGIEPDVEVIPPKMANISSSLIRKDVVFDFATDYYFKHDSIPPAASFTISDQVYDDFVLFVNQDGFDYETKSEQLLADLEEQTKEENYYTAIEESFHKLEENIKHDKSRDLEKFKDQIKEILKEEIVSRYYYQTGEIEASFDKDPLVAKAIDLLNDPERYRNILTTK